jgi:hypothetical protein
MKTELIWKTCGCYLLLVGIFVFGATLDKILNVEVIWINQIQPHQYFIQTTVSTLFKI